MFQNFTAATSPEQGPPRLKRLRQEMENEGLSGLLVSRADQYQGEYVAECDERLAWLTGFTGSAGYCLVLPDIAGVFIDGRYRVQVKEQVAADAFTPVPFPEVRPGDWLRDNIAAGKVGFDPWLHTPFQIDAIRKGLEDTGIELVPCPDLIRRIWVDRPAPPYGDVLEHPLELSGRRSSDKREDIAKVLRDAGHRSAILTLPDSICWLLNIRGNDIKRIPIVQCFAIIHDDAKMDLFIDPNRVKHLSLGDAISVHSPDDFSHVLKDLAGIVRLDRKSAPLAIGQIVTAEIAYDDDPCILPKACKNEVEIEGARAAHKRDAVAMIGFLAWLDTQQPDSFTEIDVVQALEAFRSKTNALKDISFETISGSGPNGAIVHYRVTEDSNRTVNDGELLLIDSGAQYIDGTTDITRTVAIGTPSDEQRRCYTRVLQGMIAVSQARFPRGVSGRDIDPLARAPLWMEGLDYDHGTGHGVGAYLSVHEGPQSISRNSEVPLKPGMLLSNEPGYYREGAFGIRIENLIVAQTAVPLGDNRDQLSFETLTWVPFDRNLIDTNLLSPAERSWIDSYHATIRETINARPDAANWLENATAPL
ncbi:MAG: aminopeptidase P family protein [Litoreibacter sp.]